MLLFTLLTALSIGVFILPFAVAASVTAAWAIRRLTLAAAVGAVCGGVLAAIGLTVLMLAFARGPLVQCLPNGASSSPTYWWGGGGSGGGRASISGGPPGSGAPTTGTFTRGSATFHFTCEGARLVEVRRD
jgi:hypothetical protein